MYLITPIRNKDAWLFIPAENSSHLIELIDNHAFHEDEVGEPDALFYRQARKHIGGSRFAVPSNFQELEEAQAPFSPFSEGEPGKLSIESLDDIETGFEAAVNLCQLTVDKSGFFVTGVLNGEDFKTDKIMREDVEYTLHVA
jgi:hypothetical protein